MKFHPPFLSLLSETKSDSTVKARCTWLADGSKLCVRDAGSTGFDYLGSLTYTSNSSGLTLETAQFAGGVIRSGNSQEINYFLTDHLGSVRAIVNASGSVVEQNDYYAFGAKHIRSNYPQNSNRLDLNGKEEQTTGNLKFLDYGARMYDNTIGRWFNVDPLAESYFSQSPFHYTGNNPVNLIDRNGMWYDGYVVDDWGNFTWINTIGGDQYDVIYSGKGFWDALINWVMNGEFITSYSITISPEFMDNHDRVKMWEWNLEGDDGRYIFADYYLAKDIEEGRKIFEFLANNTAIEWGYWQMKKFSGEIRNTIFTSHDEGRTRGHNTMLDRFEKQGFTEIIRNDHNHFKGFKPSGINGDIDFVRGMKNDRSSPNAIFYIYFQKEYYQYDENYYKNK